MVCQDRAGKPYAMAVRVALCLGGMLLEGMLIARGCESDIPGGNNLLE